MADLKYAHIKNGVIYNIDTTQYDDKADSDVLINKENCPQLVFTFIKGDSTQTKYMLLSDYIKDGDSYISSGKTNESGDDTTYFEVNYINNNVTTYFGYMQYEAEKKHVDSIINGTGTYTIPFYLNASSGTVTNPFSDMNGEYQYSYVIKHDGNNTFVEHNISNALVDVANEKATEVITKGGYKFKVETDKCKGISVEAVEKIVIDNE